MPSVVIFTLVLASSAICTVHMQGIPESSDPNCSKTGDAPCSARRDKIYSDAVVHKHLLLTVHKQQTEYCLRGDLQHIVDMNYVYTACTFTCEGDEIIVLQNNEKCYLPGGKGASPSKNSNGATGKCVDGKCIPK